MKKHKRSKCLSMECSGIWEKKGVSGGMDYGGEKAMGQNKQGNGPEYIKLVMCISSVHTSDLVIRQGIVEKWQSHRRKTFKKNNRCVSYLPTDIRKESIMIELGKNKKLRG